MSFPGHWNRKFPFVPPSAFPGAAVHVSWTGRCGLSDSTTTASARMHSAASYKSRGFACVRPLRSSRSWSRAVAISQSVYDAGKHHLHEWLLKSSPSQRMPWPGVERALMRLCHPACS